MKNTINSSEKIYEQKCSYQLGILPFFHNRHIHHCHLDNPLACCKNLQEEYKVYLCTEIRLGDSYTVALSKK